MAGEPLVGRGLLVDVPLSHSDTPNSVGLLRTSDRPVAENSDNTQHTQETCPWAGFEPCNPSNGADADPHLETVRPPELIELLITSMKIVVVVWNVTTS